MIKPEERKIRYYNLTLYSKKPWHQYDDQVKTIGEKISASKTGKSITFKDPTERARKISEAKKGKKHPIGSKTGRARKPHTEEWKAANSARMKMQWTNGARSKEDASLRMRGNEHAKR